MDMEYFMLIPEDITLDILARVQTESVLACKLVCTNWRYLVSHHPSFSKMHLHHVNHPFADSGKSGFIALTKYGNNEISVPKFQYFEYVENHDQSTTTPIQRITRFNFTLPIGIRRCSIVGSINGLLCLSRGPYVSICNPITKHYVVLPEIKIEYRKISHVSLIYGFGYVSSSNEYKVVGIYTSETHVEVHIYTLGSGNGWRNLGNFNSQFSKIPWHQAIFADGTLYWIGSELEMVVTFDLAEEKFCELLAPPPLPHEGHWWLNRIGLLDEFLFFAVNQVVQGVKCYDIWILTLRKENDSHGMKETEEEHPSQVWSKKVRLDGSELFADTKSDRVLTYMDNYLNIYDTKASTSKKLMECKEYFREVIPHRNTLVSLKELGEESTKILDSVES